MSHNVGVEFESALHPLPGSAKEQTVQFAIEVAFNTPLEYPAGQTVGELDPAVQYDPAGQERQDDTEDAPT